MTRRNRTFEEYRNEKLAEIEKLEAKLRELELKRVQEEHQVRRAENQAMTQDKNRRKRRTHQLITKGAAIEAICPSTRFLGEEDFYELMEEILTDPRLEMEKRILMKQFSIRKEG